ncbi:hypothetical protein Pyn_39216 [Prunus yedoensis var. nudiflora]|uniref:Uncharacterized protein n=1 Tax=Prunus yedoensis var. nudiflora TaxID=2094558 RepID=A0A314UL94_PRUYE|nr:hypothetical protein Pyn_39216 [Prunus yedoensis var. nudiflora]
MQIGTPSPKTNRKKAPAVPSRPSAPVAARSSVTSAAPTVSSWPRPSPSRKRSREVVGTKTRSEQDCAGRECCGHGGCTRAIEKRVLLVLSKGKDEEEVPPVVDTAADAEVVVVEALDAEATIAEALDVETVVAEVSVSAAAVAEPSAGEAAVAMSLLVASTGSPSVVSTVPLLAAAALAELPPATPRHPTGIMIGSTVLAIVHGPYCTEPVSCLGRCVRAISTLISRIDSRDRAYSN